MDYLLLADDKSRDIVRLIERRLELQSWLQDFDTIEAGGLCREPARL